MHWVRRLASACCRFAAFLEDVDLFDAAHFRLSRAEATSIDPQTRLLLQVGDKLLLRGVMAVCMLLCYNVQYMLMQVSAKALAQSGGAQRSTGTYVGCMFVDYMNLQREAYGHASSGGVSSSRSGHNCMHPSHQCPPAPCQKEGSPVRAAGEH